MDKPTLLQIEIDILQAIIAGISSQVFNLQGQLPVTPTTDNSTVAPSTPVTPVEEVIPQVPDAILTPLVEETPAETAPSESTEQAETY